jgi:hypothetical protein
MAAATITATYLLWPSPHVVDNFTESFGPTASRSGSPLMLKDAATSFPGCPTDMNSSRQARRLIVTASALFSDSEDGDEKKADGAGKDEEKESDDKNEDQGVDRLWDACKCG